MRRIHLLGLAGAATLGVGVTALALAHASGSDHGPRPGGPPFAMGPGPMGMGPMGMGPLMDGPLRLFDEVDADHDGRVTEIEAATFRETRFTAADADRDGVLTLDEYRTFWDEMTRRARVRSFQRQDDDGDAKVTRAEFDRPFTELQEMLDRNDDGAVSRDELRPSAGGGRHGRRGPPEREPTP